MSKFVGDFAPSAVVRIGFNTNDAAGTPITLSGGTLAVHKDGSTTQSTTGVTLTTDFDSVTGYHVANVDTSADGTFYSAGSDFRVYLTAGTVDGTSVVGALIGSFSIANRSALRPTTAGRTLDVSAGGEAGIDWANVGSPTTTLNLSGTTISASQIVASVAGNVGGNVVGTVASIVGVTFPTNFSALAITGGGAVTAGTVSDKTGYSLAAAGLDSVVVETGLNARQALSLNAAALAGVLAGAGTTTITIKGAGVATTRITATVDPDGNRSALTLNAPA